ncbi:MAG: hypothetical protein IJS60_00845 [Abditibacteriota bacterium]|nr:hypothetical protein [Abditibacteriota bacterium]
MFKDNTDFKDEIDYLYELAITYKFDTFRNYIDANFDDGLFYKNLNRERFRNSTNSFYGHKLRVVELFMNDVIWSDGTYYMLYEESQNRLVSHFKDGYMCVSAFTPRESEDEAFIRNIRSHKNLKADISQRRLGYIDTVGIWNDEKEYSVLIPYVGETFDGTPYTEEDWKRWAQELCKQYDQQCVLYKLPSSDEAFFIDKKGHTQSAGRIVSTAPKNLAKEYTKLRKYGNREGVSVTVLKEDVADSFSYDLFGISAKTLYSEKEYYNGF